jgi:hypothetical protein
VVVLILLVVLGVPLGIAISRSTELFVLRVRRGKVHFVRGRIPQGLLKEVQDVFGRAQESGRLRVTLVRGSASVDAQGEISAATLQRLRNVIGSVPVQRIRSGSAPR